MVLFMNSSNENSGRFLPELLLTTLLIFIFAVSALGIVLIGGEVYKNIVASSDESFELRTGLSYIATKVRQGDRAGMIGTDTIGGLPALVIREEYDGDVFEQWIYHYDGALREAYVLGGVEIEPEDGYKVMDIASVSMDVSGNIVSISVETSGGQTASMNVGLRTGAGG